MTTINHNDSNFEGFEWTYHEWAKENFLTLTKTINISKINGKTVSEIRDEQIIKTLDEYLYITQVHLRTQIESFFYRKYDVNLHLPIHAIINKTLSEKYGIKRCKYIIAGKQQSVIFYLKEKEKKAKKELQKIQDDVENPRINELKNNIKNANERIKKWEIELKDLEKEEAEKNEQNKNI